MVGASRRAEGGSFVSARINHVSVNAKDLQESVDFYVDLLGAEPIPTPNFGIPVQWLALGRTQLHLFERDIQPTSHHHLGITVDDLEPVYRAAERRGAFDRARVPQSPGRAARRRRPALRSGPRRQPRRDRPLRRRPPARRSTRSAEGPVGVQPAERRADARTAVRARVATRRAVGRAADHSSRSSASPIGTVAGNRWSIGSSSSP